ncbi:MAG: TlpA disulfide reductase family protein [Bdellovibrionota bacterium]
MTDPSVNSRNNASKVLVPILTIGLVAVMVVAGLSILRRHLISKSGTSNSSTVEAGGLVPEFTLHKFMGEDVRSTELKAKVILINFWASWCESCVVEMPALVRLAKTYQNRGFLLIPVSVDEKPEEVLPRLIRSFQIDFPIYTDVDGTVSSVFDVYAIPFTVVYSGKTGKVLMVESGERDWGSQQIHAKIEQWLNE